MGPVQVRNGTMVWPLLWAHIFTFQKWYNGPVCYLIFKRACTGLLAFTCVRALKVFAKICIDHACGSTE